MVDPNQEDKPAAIKLQGFEPVSVVDQAKKKFGPVIAHITNQDNETCLMIAREGKEQQTCAEYMTIKHHKNGGFYCGSYDLSKKRAFACLNEFADRWFNRMIG